MAHAYTTKRGKNKLAKLGVRRDQQQNQERMLKKVEEPPKYDGPKEEMQVKIAGHLGYHSSGSVDPILSIESQKQERCGFQLCAKSSIIDDTKLLECSACRSIKYCCRDCQLGHWNEHKDLCKTIRRKRQKEEEDKKLIASLSASFEGLQKEEAKVETNLAEILATAIKAATPSEIPSGEATQAAEDSSDDEISVDK